jgi:hypothetical protein
MPLGKVQLRNTTRFIINSLMRNKVKVLFLDRDGTIIHDNDYIKSADRVELISGSDTAMAKAKAAGASDKK